MSLLILVKLGGSVLTDKTQPESLNLPILRSIIGVLAEQIREQPSLRALIGHGGGSYGHYWAEQYRTHEGAHDRNGWYGVARVADAMGRLNRVIVAELLAAQVAAIGVAPSASAVAADRQLQQLETRSIERWLEVGVVPVVHGDVVVDRVQGAAIVSTEAVFALLAPRLQPQRIILIGESAVFTADPRRDSTAQRIGEINEVNIEAVLQQTGASHGTDVTGGMASKVQQMWSLVQSVPGLEVQLVGTDPAALQRALRGEAIDQGTIIRCRMTGEGTDT